MTISEGSGHGPAGFDRRYVKLMRYFVNIIPSMGKELALAQKRSKGQDNAGCI